MPNYMDELFEKIKAKNQPKKETQENGSKQTQEEQKPKVTIEIPYTNAKKENQEKPSQSIENQKTQPSQDTAKTKEDEEDEENIISETEKKMEKAEKELIESNEYGKIFKIRGQEMLYYHSPVTRPTGGERAIINTIKEAATRIITIVPYKIRDPEQRRNVYFQKIIEILRESPELRIPSNKIEFYADAVVREMIGYGIIDTLIKDPMLEEIMVIAPKTPVFVFHRKYGMMLTNIEFYSDNEIQDLINRMSRTIGRRVDLASPLLDARLLDGSRVNATIPPASVEGSTLTIRKFRPDPYTIIDLINYNTINSEAAAFLWLAVEGMRARPANILIAGGTGSGKTTLLNVLAAFIPAAERVISIEDTAELKLPLKHWVRLEAKPPGLEGTGEITMDILTKNALRMRPDRIIVGEIRHAEAFALFTAMNTGHAGSMGTVHANSPQETIVRVTNPPMNVPEVMMAGLNFIIIEHRLHDKILGTIRRITEIAEVTGALEGKTKTEPIYRRDAATDSLLRTKAPIQFLKQIEEGTGLTQDRIMKELKARQELLESLVEKKITKLEDVSEATEKFLIEER